MPDRAAAEELPAPVALAARLDAVLDSRALRGARVAALVVDAVDGGVLYERSPDRALTPASNMKVLTALAALDTFGPAHRFETPVLALAPPDAEGAVGDLFLRGSGDPALTSEDWWRLAAELHALGVRRVRGDLVLDDSAFDDARWHPDWGRTSSRAYHGPVSAINANYGAFAVTVVPGAQAGEPVRIAVTPPVPYLQVVDRAVTRGPGSRRSLVVDRRSASGGELVTVDGAMPAGGKPRTVWRSVLDPTRYAGAIWRMQLEALGVAIDGGVRVGPTPAAAGELLRFEGRPVAEIVRLFVKYSNNAVAESLVKAMGARQGGVGSWETGVPAVRSRLAALGVGLDGLVLVDGSGLSYRDKLTPRSLVQALAVARGSFRLGPELTASLPIAALDGTLDSRAEAAEGRVRAKTGLLNRVTSLSGYAERAEGGVAIFSVLSNGYRVSDDEAMRALDRFAAAIAEGL